MAGGRVVIEHGYDQAESVGQLAVKWGYTDIQAHHDLAGVPRFLVATWSS